MKSHAATKEEREWMNAIRELGCIVCLLEWDMTTPPEIHHIAGKTKPGTHMLTIPLCKEHHRGQRDDQICTSRHPWKQRFEERYGSELELLNECRRRI